MKVLLLLLQTVLILLAAPLLSGIIKKIKNNIRMRRGAPVLQPYYNILKFFRKDETVSRDTSYIFRAAPYIVLASSLVAAFLASGIFPLGRGLEGVGDIFVLIFVFSLGRFFLALAGLDAGSSFGGMGSSREMFISALAEPALLLSVFAASLSAGTTGINALAAAQPAFKIPLVCGGLSFYLVLLAETSRVPVDNQETHLELTMIHEAMILEYSGKSLALIELASYVKQFVLISLLASVFFPGNSPFFWVLKVLAITGITAVVEVLLAKMRLFRAVDYLILSFVISLAAVAVFVMGA